MAIQQIKSQAISFGKNLIINGGMNVYQRTANSGSISTTSGYNLADRYLTTGLSHGSQTHGIETDVPSGYGFASSYRIYRDGINDFAAPNPSTANILTLSQKIEGQNLQHLCKGTSNAKKLTLSFWSKFAGNGANGSVYVVELVDLDNSRQISKALTSSSDWTKNIVTFPADTTGTLDNDNNASLQVNIWLNAGSDYTSGTFNDSAWASTTDANRVKSDVMHFNSVDTSTGAPTSFHFTGVQLEVGEIADPEFEFEPYDVTENKCFRYFYAHEFGAQEYIYNESATNTSTWVQVYFPVKMRASSGSITLSSGMTGGAVNGLSGTVSNVTLQELAPTKVSLRVTMSTSSGTARAMYHCDTFNGDFVYIDTEL
jgi:hypothetical protein